MSAGTQNSGFVMIPCRPDTRDRFRELKDGSYDDLLKEMARLYERECVQEQSD